MDCDNVLEEAVRPPRVEDVKGNGDHIQEIVYEGKFDQ